VKSNLKMTFKRSMSNVLPFLTAIFRSKGDSDLIW